MALKLAQRTPIVRLTVTAASDQQPKQQKQQQQQQQKQTSASVTQCDSATATTPTSESADKDKDKDKDKDVSLLQRFKRIIDEKRESYEQERRRKLQQGSAEMSSGTMAEVILGLLTPSNLATATVDTSLATTTAATTITTTAATAVSPSKPSASVVSPSKPAATVEDDITEASTTTSTAVDLRRRRTTDNKTSTDNITLRRSQSAELTHLTRDNSQERIIAHKSTMTTVTKQTSASDISTFRLINLICRCRSYKCRVKLLMLLLTTGLSVAWGKGALS